MSVEQAGFYADFSQYHGLRAAVRDHPRDPAALRKVAAQFEALFLNLVLREMRKTTSGGGLFDSDETRFYQGMYDQQIASELTRRRGLGLADLLVRQLGETGRNMRLPSSQVRESQPPSMRSIPAPAAARPVPEPPAALPAIDVGAWRNGDPKRFVRDLLPHVQRIADAHGLPAEAILAQAALETGWGRAIPKREDGRSTYNLFGIKADRGWQGERSWATTLEFRDGALRRERSAFRAYSSPQESLSDYVLFLRRNPRYRAVFQARDAKAYAQALADAGYATDPEYADKIVAILERPEFRKALAAFKSGAGMPMVATGGVPSHAAPATPAFDRGAS